MQSFLKFFARFVGVLVATLGGVAAVFGQVSSWHWGAQFALWSICVIAFASAFAYETWRIYYSKERMDALRYAQVSRFVDDLCRRIALSTANCRPDDSPQACTARIIEDCLSQMMLVWRQYAGDTENTGKEVSIQIKGPTGDGKLKVLFDCHDAVPLNRRDEPQHWNAEGTITKKVFDTKKHVIVEDLERSEYLANLRTQWRDVTTAVRSVVAWPIFAIPVREKPDGMSGTENSGSSSSSTDPQVVMVLKIDSPVPGAFRDTAATQRLARLCVHKLEMVLAFGKALERRLAPLEQELDILREQSKASVGVQIASTQDESPTLHPRKRRGTSGNT